MKRIAYLMALCLALAAVGSACSKKQRALTAEQKAELSRYVSETPPKPQHPLDIKFAESIALIGYDVDTDKVVPGTPFNVTWYFRVDKNVGGDWKLFTHLADGAGTSRINYDDKGKLRTLFPASGWEAGSYIKDPMTIALPEDWDSDGLVVFLGFWQDEDRMPVTGPSDHDNRARALDLKVERKEPVVPSIAAPFTPVAVKLDGKLDDAVWRVAKSVELVNTLTAVPEQPTTNVKTAWDNDYFYASFDVEDDYLRSTFTADDEHLWEQDTVEIMVDPDGDGNNYFELQVSPANKHFDTRYDTRRTPRPYGHLDFNSGIKSGVAVRGKLNDEVRDEGYTVELAIPWAAFSMGDPKHERPAPGSSWRMNFFVLDARSEHDQRAVGWSAPRVGDFHVPRRFGNVVFGAPSATPAAVAAPEAQPSKAIAPVKKAKPAP
ncbi:MAG: hypothetical protein JWN04_1728 [Myxococcaceae bacterium]|nr:hypothetical protein [Myxococcaceae bacterium]